MSASDRKRAPAPRDDVEVVERTVGYAGYTRLERLRLRHRLHAGGWSPVLQREMIERGHAVAVLPYDPRRDEVVLIRQFRVGAWGAGDDPWLVETVAGIVDAGETLENVARRETHEECGCDIEALIHLCTFYTSPGILTETTALYVGITDATRAGGIHGLEHEGEDIEAFVMPWHEASESLRAGRFRDAKVVITLQWLALNREDLRRRYAKQPG